MSKIVFKKKDLWDESLTDNNLAVVVYFKNGNKTMHLAVEYSRNDFLKSNLKYIDKFKEVIPPINHPINYD